MADFDFLGLGEDLNEMVVDAGGYRRIQHMNENHTLHRGTLIENGGYGIKNELGDAPAIKGAKTQTIKHQGGRSSTMLVFTAAEVALIGWTPKYYVAEYDDPVDAGKRVSNIVPGYIRPDDLPGANGKCRSAVTLFVVLKDDPDKKLWALDFKGYVADDAQKMIFAAKALANDVARQAKAKIVHPFVHWLTLTVGESVMVGKTDQAPVSPCQWCKDGENIVRTVVTKEDYAHFINLRRELDEYLPQSKYAIRPTAPALNAPQTNRPALAPAGYTPNAGTGDFNG